MKPKFVRAHDNKNHWFFFCGAFEAEKSYYHHGEGYSFLLMFHKFKVRFLKNLGAIGFQYCFRGYFFDHVPYVFCFYFFRLKMYFLKRERRSGPAKWHLSFLKF
jgi:hypothetical protein